MNARTSMMGKIGWIFCANGKQRKGILAGHWPRQSQSPMLTTCFREYNQQKSVHLIILFHFRKHPFSFYQNYPQFFIPKIKMKMKFTILLICLFLNSACGNIRQKRGNGEDGKEESAIGSSSSHPSHQTHTDTHHHQTHGKPHHETEEHNINELISEAGANMHRTDIDNLIFTAFPEEQKEYIYKFTGKFHPQRIELIIYIAENGGSVQSHDALQLPEYLKIQELSEIFDFYVNQRKWKKLDGAKIREIFLIAKENLIEKLKKFEKENSEMIKNPEKISDGFILKCKQFMRELHSEGNEGSFFDIFSFWEEKKYSNLKKIFETADIHSENVDKLINLTIWNEHERLKNKISNKKFSPKNVIIEGAGPIGLFAAFQFFLAGMNVRLVNNREEYNRRQMVFLDRKWMSQLRFLLGTKFRVLFNKKTKLGQETSLGRIDYGDVGQVNVREIEKIMKERLMELKKFKESQTDLKEDLVLMYGFEFEKIVEPQKKADKFQGIIVEKKKAGNGEKGKENAKEFPVDLLICAGGANDQIRNKYLGDPIEETDPKSYGVVVLVKGKEAQPIFDDQTVFFKLDNLENDEFKQIIDEQKFNEFIEQNREYFTETFTNKFKHLSEMIKNERNLIVRLFENRPTIHIATINTIQPIREFFDELTDLEKNKAHNENKYKKIRIEMERKWSAVIFKISLSHVHKEKIGKIELKMTGEKQQDVVEENVLYFDPNSANTSIFWVTIRSVPNAARKMENHGKSMIIAAVGDANTSPHFMTASGLSTGRIAVERVLKIHKTGKKYKWNEMFTEMKIALSSLKNQVVKKVLEQTDMELAKTSKFDKDYAEFLVRPYRLPENKRKMAGSG